MSSNQNVPPFKPEDEVRLYVPFPGDEILLTRDWTFKLHNEKRNVSLFAFMKGSNRLKETKDRWGYTIRHPVYDSRMVTLKAGCLLEVDRIYIRKGQEGWDSITFQLLEIPESMKEDVTDVRHGKKLIARFWTKILDANNIYFEPATKPDIELDLG